VIDAGDRIGDMLLTTIDQYDFDVELCRKVLQKYMLGADAIKSIWQSVCRSIWKGLYSERAGTRLYEP
jgi:hypothetical protein